MLQKNHGAKAEATLLQRVRQQLDPVGTLDLLRHGVEVWGCPRPSGSRTEFILRSCQERARDVLLDRTLFSFAPEQTTALLADLEDPCAAGQDQASSERLLAMPQPWHAPA